MIKIIVSILVCSAITVSGLWNQTQASGESEKINAEQLFESKCKLCHTIDRPKSKKKPKEGWKMTVMRMKNKNGAPLTNEEAEIIINYLAEKYGI